MSEPAPRIATQTLPLAERLERLKPSAIREIHNLADRLKLENPGKSVIALHFGEPDLGTPPFIVEAGVAALRNGAVFYENNSGRNDLKAELARYFRERYDLRLTEDNFLITCGGVQAICLSMLGLLAPGDEMINVTPAWPNFTGAAELAGATVHDLPLTFDGAERRYFLDFSALEALAQRCRNLRVVVVNTPSNPTGWVMQGHEKQRILDFCRERGAYLVGDEMYDRIVFDGADQPSFLQLREAGGRLVLINGFSKTYAMTGWRLGYLIAEPQLVQRLAQMQEYVTSCAPSMAQVAAITALREGEPFIAESLARYRNLRDIVVERLAAIPGSEFANPGGGFYAFFRHPATEDSVRFCRELLRSAGVVLAPGRAFGGGGEGWVRICFAQRPEILDEAMNRLTQFVSGKI